MIDLVQGSKRALKQTGDHNLDLERMQFKNDRGNVSKAKDYINKETEADNVKFAMGKDKTNMIADKFLFSSILDF